MTTASDAARVAERRILPIPPTFGFWDSYHTSIGAGVAIFHLKTSRVVLCRYIVERVWCLPKGRRELFEDTALGAEREGFEMSGYRNRLLPLPIPHGQPIPDTADDEALPFNSEPVWTQLTPVGSSLQYQYILFWYIAETVPPDVEKFLSNREEEQQVAYVYPPEFPQNITLKQRADMEREGYEPVRHMHSSPHEGDEPRYDSFLLPVAEAIEKLGDNTITADVIRRGWELICLRRRIEDGDGRFSIDDLGL